MSFVQGVQLHQFIEDLRVMIDGDAQWGGVFGIKPAIRKKTGALVTQGYVGAKQEDIIIYADAEKIKPFTIGIAVGSVHKSHHSTLLATIEISTNLSEERLEQLVSAVKNILTNPANIRKAGYIQILIKGYRNLSEELREAYSGIIDVEAHVLNPLYSP